MQVGEIDEELIAELGSSHTTEASVDSTTYLTTKT